MLNISLELNRRVCIGNSLKRVIFFSLLRAFNTSKELRFLKQNRQIYLNRSVNLFSDSVHELVEI